MAKLLISGMLTFLRVNNADIILAYYRLNYEECYLDK